MKEMLACVVELARSVVLSGDNELSDQLGLDLPGVDGEPEGGVATLSVVVWL